MFICLPHIDKWTDRVPSESLSLGAVAHLGDLGGCHGAVQRVHFNKGAPIVREVPGLGVVARPLVLPVALQTHGTRHQTGH